MVVVRQTRVFARWMADQRDLQTRARIGARIDRLAFGHAGDVQPVGGGISELRIHFGPGYRVYFVRRGEAIILLLCGGDKGSQPRDIVLAKHLAAQEKDEV